jgi:proton-translocating NADH-quinone oxidoreductase chain M
MEFLIIILVILCIFAIFCISFVEAQNKYLMRKVSIYISQLVYILSLAYLVIFDKTSGIFQFVYESPLIPLLNINLVVGIDGISIFLIILTTLLTSICILVSWEAIENNLKYFLILLFLTQIFLLGAFSMLNFFFFFVSFEAVIIPVSIIIGVWGSRERRIYASFSFILYTLIGSITMFLGIMYLLVNLGSVNFTYLYLTNLELNAQLILWLAFFISFAVKVPMMPFHLWLPEAHVEAPTAGSILLAGVLLKLGIYGFLRVSLPIFPYASLYFLPFIYTICCISILYSSFIIFRQIDLKKIIAYSSIAHMNIAVMGIFANNIEGINGGIYLMLTHGIISSALFACVGMLYDRYKTRLVTYYSGLATIMPVYATLFFMLTLANMGLPITSGFIAEFLVLIGVGQISYVGVIVILVGVILCSIYSMWVFTKVFFGTVPMHIKYYSDLNKREFQIIAFLVFVMFLMGIYPSFFFDYIDASVINLIEIMRK